MEVIITEWALNAYLDLKSEKAFTDEQYRKTMRPDVLLLRHYPNDPKFKNSKFWSQAQGQSGDKIQKGYKMKWHQMGNGKVQLRLPVGILGEAYLCEAYVKKNSKQERRQMAKFKTHLELIRQGRVTARGRLS